MSGVLPADAWFDSRAFDPASVDAFQGDALPEDREPFATLGTFPLRAGGMTDLLTLPIDANVGTLFLRTTASEAMQCFQLDSVGPPNGAAWVPPAATNEDWGPYCTTCPQRVSLGHGYGLFGFPNDGSELPFPSELTFRVVLRDCTTMQPLFMAGAPIPDAVRVEWATRLPPSPSQDDAEGVLRVSFAFAPGTQFSVGDSLLSAALSEANTRLSPAHLSLELVGKIELASDRGAELTFGSMDRTPLDSLTQEARAAMTTPAIPVIFVPCLTSRNDLTSQVTHPNGFVPRIPGGFPIGGFADAIFINGRSCPPAPDATYWLSGGLLSKTLVHELGHYLGLYHTVEASGQEDHLSDTDAQNLMYHQALDSNAQGFSPSQIAVMRRHPAVIYP